MTLLMSTYSLTFTLFTKIKYNQIWISLKKRKCTLQYTIKKKKNGTISPHLPYIVMPSLVMSSFSVAILDSSYLWSQEQTLTHLRQDRIKNVSIFFHQTVKFSIDCDVLRFIMLTLVALLWRVPVQWLRPMTCCGSCRVGHRGHTLLIWVQVWIVIWRRWTAGWRHGWGPGTLSGPWLRWWMCIAVVYCRNLHSVTNSIYLYNQRQHYRAKSFLFICDPGPQNQP